MITGQQVRQLLEQRPFRPFRLYVSDQSRFDVPHPEFAWVFGSRVFVGESSGADQTDGGRVQQLSLLHLTRIEELPLSAPPESA